MIQFNRETMMIAGIVVCVLAVLYVYRDLQKTKEKIQNVSSMQTVTNALAYEVKKPVVEAAPVAPPVAPPPVAPVPQVSEKAPETGKE